MNSEILIKIEGHFDTVYANTHSIPFMRDNIDKIGYLTESIPEEDIKLQIIDIIKNIRSSILLEEKLERDNIISKCYKEAKYVLFSYTIKLLEKFQKELEKTNIDDFYFINNDSINATLAGSFDFCYYHDVEIKFLEVEFICCPSHFHANRFRIASKEEILELSKFMYGYDGGGLVICMEDTNFGDKFFIVAHGIETKWETVYYYKRDNLKPGERIADWVL